MNKTERRYSELLEQRRAAGEVIWWKFEAIALRLAEQRCAYHPDFLVMLADGTMEVHEVKGGFTREDAQIKLKVAASLYPFVFRKCVWDKGEWTITEIRRQEAARGMEAAKPAKRAAIRPAGRQPGPKDAPKESVYSGGPIPKGMAVIGDRLVPESEALAEVQRHFQRRAS